MKIGYVDTYSSEMGFGYIQPDDSSQLVFFSDRVVSGGKIELWDSVEYKLYTNHGTNPEAKYVRVLSHNRAITPLSIQGNQTPITDLINDYKTKGYYEFGVDSGTGSRLLFHHKVIKINQDSAYNHFIEFALKNKSLAVPKIYLYKKYGVKPYEGDSGFTVIEMEYLLPLNNDERYKYQEWINDYIENVRNNTDFSDDPFELLATVNLLVEYANQNQLNLDIFKTSNIMKNNSNIFVIIDPFN